MAATILSIVRGQQMSVDDAARPVATEIASTVSTVSASGVVVVVSLKKNGVDAAQFAATVTVPYPQGGAPTSAEFFLGSANDLIRLQLLTLPAWFKQLGVANNAIAALAETTMRNLMIAYGSTIAKASGVTP